MKALLLLCVGLMLAGTRAWHDDSFAHPFECLVCNATEYCTNGEATACPANSAISIQVPNRDGTLSQCICNAGYEVDHSQSLVHTCQDGIPPYYYQGGHRNNCPQHKETTENLASLISDCKCVPGYEKRSDTVFCDACVSNEYSDMRAAKITKRIDISTTCRTELLSIFTCGKQLLLAARQFMTQAVEVLTIGPINWRRAWMDTSQPKKPTKDVPPATAARAFRILTRTL